LPTTTDEERRRLLSFVVCGGGPTGVEFAAELYDMLNEDLVNVFPKILRCEISVHLVQSRGHILNTYDEALSKFAEVILYEIPYGAMGANFFLSGTI
jgi:NADH dehydrogenase